MSVSDATIWFHTLRDEVIVSYRRAMKYQDPRSLGRWEEAERIYRWMAELETGSKWIDLRDLYDRVVRA